jgi:hypothetical protein
VRCGRLFSRAFVVMSDDDEVAQEFQDRELTHEDLRGQHLLHEGQWYLVKSGGPKKTKAVLASRGAKKCSSGRQCTLDTAPLLQALHRQRTSWNDPRYDDLEEEEAEEGGDCFCGNTDEPEEGTQWIECDECTRWCHLTCAEQGESPPDKNQNHYVCPRCLDADDPDTREGADGPRKKRAKKSAAPAAPPTNEKRRVVLVDARSGSPAALVPGKAGAYPTLPDVPVATIERDLTGLLDELDWDAARKTIFASVRWRFEQAFRSGPAGYRVTVKHVRGIGVVAVTCRRTLTVPSSPPPRHPPPPLPPSYIHRRCQQLQRKGRS